MRRPVVGWRLHDGGDEDGVDERHHELVAVVDVVCEGLERAPVEEHQEQPDKGGAHVAEHEDLEERRVAEAALRRVYEGEDLHEREEEGGADR